MYQISVFARTSIRKTEGEFQLTCHNSVDSHVIYLDLEDNVLVSFKRRTNTEQKKNKHI